MLSTPSPSAAFHAARISSTVVAWGCSCTPTRNRAMGDLRSIEHVAVIGAGGRPTYEDECDHQEQRDQRVHSQLDLRVREHPVGLVLERLRTDEEDVSNRGDHTDDEERHQLEAAALEVRQHGAEDLEDDHDE